MLSQRRETLFIAAWVDALMIHFQVDAKELQRDVPFQLDLLDGKAFVSLVAFTMRGMRPRLGGKLAALLFRPIATHHFLNVRTYVRHAGECGIHFIAEWLTSRLAVMLGPTTFGLPYRYGRISYRGDLENAGFTGQVADVNNGAALKFEARLARLNNYQTCATIRRRGAPLRSEASSFAKTTADRVVGRASALPLADFRPCAAGSMDEWFMERYIAFNSANGRRRFFRVWHPPWPQRPAEIILGETSLLTKNWPWFKEARIVGSNFSPGFETVWMGRPNAVP
jgi:hypothetical protein